MISKLFDVLISNAQQTRFGNIEGFTAKDMLTNFKALLATCDFSKLPEGAGVSDILTNLATSAYDIHGIKLAESLIGMLVYISADKTNIGDLDRGTDAARDHFVEMIKNVLNEFTDQQLADVAKRKAAGEKNVTTPSPMSHILGFGLAVPLVSGGVVMQDGKTEVQTDITMFINEIVAASKELGMNLDGIIPKTNLDQ